MCCDLNLAAREDLKGRINVTCVPTLVLSFHTSLVAAKSIRFHERNQQYTTVHTRTLIYYFLICTSVRSIIPASDSVLQLKHKCNCLWTSCVDRWYVSSRLCKGICTCEDPSEETRKSENDTTLIDHLIMTKFVSVPPTHRWAIRGVCEEFLDLEQISGP